LCVGSFLGYFDSGAEAGNTTSDDEYVCLHTLLIDLELKTA
jgi:hypothetical protein